MFGMEPEELDHADEDAEEIPWWVSIILLVVMFGVIWVCALLTGPGSYGGP